MLGQVVDGGFGGREKGGDDRGAGKDVRISEVRPGRDGEGAAGVLGLDCAYGGDRLVEISTRGYGLRTERGHIELAATLECILPMSPNFRSSKSRNFFRREISLRLLMVRSPKSSTMSAWVLRTHIESPTSSASRKRAEVELTSADTQRLDFLTAMRWRR